MPFSLYPKSSGGGGGGNVTGISPTIIDNVTSWADATGTTIKDGGVRVGFLKFDIASDTDLLNLNSIVILAWDATNRQFIFKQDPGDVSLIEVWLDGSVSTGGVIRQINTPAVPLNVGVSGIYLSSDGLLDPDLDLLLNGDGLRDFTIAYTIDASTAYILNLMGGSLQGDEYTLTFMSGV